MTNLGPGDKGWPRPFLEYRSVNPDRVSEKKPALFVGGDNQLKNDWTSFDEDKSNDCQNDNLCVACGEPLNRIWLFGHSRNRETNGPAAHPRCFALALRFCPRFQAAPYTHPSRVVAYRYEGPRPRLMATNELLYEDNYRVPASCTSMRRHQCLALAKSDPLGMGDQS